MNEQMGYFTILLRQKANLASMSAAERLAGAVPVALDTLLPQQQLEQIFQLLPNAASQNKPKFYHRLSGKKQQPDFTLAVYLQRLMTLLNLTGVEEAVTYTQAYFRSAIALMDQSDSTRLLGTLPPQLAALIYA